MSPAQREDMTAAVIDATTPLHARIEELEADLKDAQAQLAELGKDLAMAEEHKEDVQDMIGDAYSRGLTDGAAELEPMRSLLLALHKLIEGNDTVQYHAPSNTLFIGRATFAALGDKTILQALRTAAVALRNGTILCALINSAIAFTGEAP